MSINGRAWIERNIINVSFTEKFSQETGAINFQTDNLKNVTPSITIETNRFKSSKDQDLRLSFKILFNTLFVDAHYKYYQYLLHCQARSGQSNIGNNSITAIYDVNNDQKTLFATKISQNNTIQFGIQYPLNINNILSFKISNDLKQCKFGFMKENIFNDKNNTIYGQIEYKQSGKAIKNNIDAYIGMNKKLNEETSISAFMNNNLYGFVGLNYCLFLNEYTTSKIDSKIGVSFDLNQQSFTPKYQCFLEWYL